MLQGNDTQMFHDTLSDSNVVFCLGHLTEMGKGCYLTFYLYVEILCIRLTQYRTIQINNQNYYPAIPTIQMDYINLSNTQHMLDRLI
jgi:hypothetical protein